MEIRTGEEMVVILDDYDLETRCGSESFGQAFLAWAEKWAARKEIPTHRAWGHGANELTNDLWEKFCSMSMSTYYRYGYSSKVEV